MNSLLKIAITASIEAGREIIKVYNTNFDVEYKEDSSPLTVADRNAHEKIMEYLMGTDIPVLSEEGKTIPYEVRKNWDSLWIVDPLDGTKEFIKRNDEFTVNIALIQNNKPVLGVVYAPVLDELYFGDINQGSYKVVSASEIDYNELYNNRLPSFSEKDYYGVVASRSHLSEKTEEFINNLKEIHNNIKIISRGSSLKLCMIAEGMANQYPRLGPTMEWDTAAGHAVVIASGGKVLQAPEYGNELVYNKKNLLNPWFVASR